MIKRKLYNCLAVLTAAVILVSLASCRKRVVPDAEEPESSTAQQESQTPESGQAAEQQTLQPEQADSRPGTGDGPVNTEEQQQVNTGDADSGAEVTVPEAGSGQARPSEEGDTIGAIVDQYTGLLNEGLGTLYECHIPYVYLELPSDYQTVNQHSPLHAFLLESGGYNAAEFRGDDALTVDTAWITRKNPAVIVKFVPSSVLGAGAKDTQAAAAFYSQFVSREGWGGLSAVINRRVILLSEELLSSENGKFIGKLYLARAMHPELFSGFDVDALKGQVLGGSGCYYYS